MALPLQLRNAVDALHDLVTADSEGCVSQRILLAGVSWKVRIRWVREGGKVTFTVTIQER